MGPPPNTLYYGDNLDILRRYVADESADLIYLDPPPSDNSNADYNVLFAEKDGTQPHAQIKAFEDTWSWDLEAAAEYTEVLGSGTTSIAAMRCGRSSVGMEIEPTYLGMARRRAEREANGLFATVDLQFEWPGKRASAG